MTLTQGEVEGTLNGGIKCRELWMGKIKGTLNGGGNTAWGKWKEHWMGKVQET